MKVVLILLASVTCAAAQQDYRLQRDICLDTSSQVSALWTARYSDASIKIQEQQGKMTELQAKIGELERQLADAKSEPK
jgi:hypothetical protein